jgi:hypothetical protein
MIKTHCITFVLFSVIFLTIFSSNSYSQNVPESSNSNRTSIATLSGPESGSITIIDMVGDIDCSNNLHEQIKKDNPTYFVALGDLCYESDLTKFKGAFGDLEKDGELACLIGNHDAEEDANTKIFKEAQAFCDDHWYLKVAKGTTLLIGLDTNGDMKAQISWAQSLVTNSTLIDGVKNVILLSHKPAHTPPKSHHPVEAPVLEMYTAIESKIPNGLNVYEIAGHNHFMAQSNDDKWLISGAGGRSHYEGESDAVWPFFNNVDYGYLQLKIDNNDGKVTANFYGLDGKLIH